MIHSSFQARVGSALVLVGALLLSTSWLPTAARAQEPDHHAELTRQLNGWLARMRQAPFTARMTACSGWECNDATLHVQQPGRLRIDYDYGSTVIASEGELVVYNRALVVYRQPLAEADLSLLLAGQVGGDVRVDAVQREDRGPLARSPRSISRVELTAGTRHLTLLFAEAPFRLVGWIAPGTRSDLVVEVRDLRREASPRADLFAQLPQPAPDAVAPPTDAPAEGPIPPPTSPAAGSTATKNQ